MRRSSRSQLIFDCGPPFFLPRRPACRLVLIAQHFEAHELVDIAGREGGLIELHAELLHPDSGYADHKSLPKEADSIVCARARSTVFARNREGSGPVTASQHSVSHYV